MKKVLYALAVFALAGAVAYGLAIDPRPCGMDDISSACGPGARRGVFIAGAVLALLLAYVGRSLGNHRD